MMSGPCAGVGGCKFRMSVAYLTWLDHPLGTRPREVTFQALGTRQVENLMNRVYAAWLHLEVYALLKFPVPTAPFQLALWVSAWVFLVAYLVRLIFSLSDQKSKIIGQFGADLTFGRIMAEDCSTSETRGGSGSLKVTK